MTTSPFTLEISSFENWIMQCCKAPEWALRKKLKVFLERAGFSFVEDDYKSERCVKEPRYSTVHNLLAVRGQPKVCLVAHTDVCRDHSYLTKDRTYNSYSHATWGSRHYSSSDQSEKPAVKIEAYEDMVHPVVKVVDIEGKETRIITDKDNRIQVGGDDRLGVAINTWIALNTGYDMGLFFPTDEEIGLRSAGACKMTELKQFDLMVQVDRGNYSDQLVTKIGGVKLCDYDTAVRLLEIAYNIGLPRKIVEGMGTDVAALKRNGLINNAVNMTCGYHHSYGDSENEYIIVNEARDTLKFVNEIVKSYYLEKH